MKINDVLKKILPVGILLLVIAVGAIIFGIITKDKKNPTLSDKQEEVYFNYNDGKITFTNEEAYKQAKNSYGLGILTEMIDQDLLADETAKVTKDEVETKLTKTIYSYETIAEYLENNELEEEEIEKTLQEKLDDFVETAFASYGINCEEGKITVSKVGDDWKLSATEGTEFYNYFKYLCARYNYGYAKLAEQYASELEDYAEYKEDYAKYEQYLSDLADYKANVITEKPAEVEQPTEPSITIKETKFEDAWNEMEEHTDGYWAIVIPYSTLTEAETALLQHGIVIKTVAVTKANVQTTKAYWFHYAIDASEETASEDKDGFNIVTSSDYYKEVAQAWANDESQATNVKANPDKNGAYVLSEEEIKQAIIDLYNQYYGWTIKESITADVITAEIAKGSESAYYLKASKATELNLLSTVSGNKFNEFDAEATDFRKFYSESVTSSYPKIYWILGKVDNTQWEDATEEAKAAFMKDEDRVAGFLKSACTDTVVNNKIDELRVEKGLVIYDTDIEADYLSSYTSTSYKETKKSSKSLIAKCDGKEYSTNAVLTAILEKYATSIALQEYQYQWMFICAAKEDGTKFNKYVDYEAFLNGKELKKCILDNDDAKELWDEIAAADGTIANIKNSFASGGYESYGYASNYGWKNFLRDFFSYYYGVNIENNDDLACYLIYQQIVEDYNLYLADVKNINWNAIETNFTNTLNNYINAVGYHFLICVKDTDGNTVAPEEWTEEQKIAAEELYGKVLSLAKDLEAKDIVTYVQALNTAYTSINKYPVAMADGSFIKTNVKNDKNNTKFNYEYTYSTDAQTYTDDKFELAYYKSLGLSVTYEELTTTDGAMVQEFEDAVREMWVKSMETILTGIADNSGQLEEVQIHDAMITTQFGYHFYVNTSFNLGAYVSESKLITLPTKDAIALYQYEANNASKDGYMSVVELVADYVEAKQLGNNDSLAKAKEAIIKAMANASLQAEVTEANVEAFTESTLYGYTNFAALTEKSTLTDKKIDADDLVKNTFVQTQITTWFNDVNTENTGSSYYQLQVVKAALAQADSFKLAEQYTGYFKQLLELYVESYEGQLTYAKSAKDIAETLIESLTYTYQLAVEYDAAVVENSKAYATELFNSLSAEDKADLQENFDKMNQKLMK